MSIDHVLKLYSEAIRSPYLHYGFWNDPSKININDISLNDVIKAQERYIEHLSSFIPKGISNILDVGAGIGGNSQFLISRGFDVDALSPDEYQENIFEKKYNGKVKFFKTKFENFISEKKYDLILQSESVCYIKIDKGWEVASQTLRDGGYLLASDYFHFKKDIFSKWHTRASHDEKKYLKSASDHGFKLIKEFDQTTNTMPTLDFAKAFYERFIDTTIEFTLNYIRTKHSWYFEFFRRLFGAKINTKMEQLSLLDSNEFRKYKRYMIYLFKKES